MNRRTFKDRSDRIDALLADPDRSARVSEIRAEMAEADRAHAMSLALVRKAASMTQAQLGEKLGVSQPSINQLEHQPDMLLSTMRAYLAAAGADLELHVRLSNGHVSEITIPQLTEEDSSPPERHRCQTRR